MANQLDKAFIQHVNENLGIAHKVARIYFYDADDRDDVLQEMMYQLWRSYLGFDGRSKFSTWMYRVCLNTALTYKRKNRAEKNESITAVHLQIAERLPENQEEAIVQLRNAISNLSPVNKAIVLLYLENMSYEEISAVTGLSRSNVSVKLVRIKKILETELRPNL